MLSDRQISLTLTIELEIKELPPSDFAESMQNVSPDK